ncbi:MAG: hypothetical protein ABR540_13615 [Acidimicrobiales bacterium]|nr:hypothetical protein [Actinomycetota bacterium]
MTGKAPDRRDAAYRRDVAEGVDEPYRDLMLASFVNLANQGTLGELGLSLVIGGGWVTGQLIGARAWFEGLARSLDDTGKAGDFGEVIRMMGAQVYPSASEREAAGDPTEDTVLPAFLHLRDAHLVGTDGRSVPTRGGFVRVRLEEVAAWMLGRIGPAGYQPPAPPV